MTTGRLSKEKWTFVFSFYIWIVFIRNIRTNDETFRFSLFDRLPYMPGDGGAIVELPLQEQNPAHLFLFLWFGGLYSFFGFGVFQLT